MLKRCRATKESRFNSCLEFFTYILIRSPTPNSPDVARFWACWWKLPQANTNACQSLIAPESGDRNAFINRLTSNTCLMMGAPLEHPPPPHSVSTTTMYMLASASMVTRKLSLCTEFAPLPTNIRAEYSGEDGTEKRQQPHRHQKW